MNKMTRNVLLTGFLLVCTYTMFSLHRASDLQKSRQSDISTLQTQINLDEPMTMDSQVVLRLANNQGPEHPASIACDYFANLVDEMSGSSPTIQDVWGTKNPRYSRWYTVELILPGSPLPC